MNEEPDSLPPPIPRSTVRSSPPPVPQTQPVSGERPPPSVERQLLVPLFSLLGGLVVGVCAIFAALALFAMFVVAAGGGTIRTPPGAYEAVAQIDDDVFFGLLGVSFIIGMLVGTLVIYKLISDWFYLRLKRVENFN